MQQLWKARLPYRLPFESSSLSENYVPASAHDTIRRAFELTGGADVAFAMLRHWLEKKGKVERDGGQAKSAIQCD